MYLITVKTKMNNWIDVIRKVPNKIRKAFCVYGSLGVSPIIEKIYSSNFWNHIGNEAVRLLECFRRRKLNVRWEKEIYLKRD